MKVDDFGEIHLQGEELAQCIEIGNISNYYGGLNIVKLEGKYWWGIDNYDGMRVEEISKELYDMLLKSRSGE